MQCKLVFHEIFTAHGEANLATQVNHVKASIPSHDEFEELPAALFMTEGVRLIGCMHQLICKIWQLESMPSDWNLSVPCPGLKKGDPIFDNYRSVSLIPIAYKILSAILCDRLKSLKF